LTIEHALNQAFSKVSKFDAGKWSVLEDRQKPLMQSLRVQQSRISAL
jgi:hypothetical protein